MADRQRFPLPFGDGLDRASGVTRAEPRIMRDLRNVYIEQGRIALRKGLAAKQTLADESAICGIFPVRSMGVGVVVTYRASDRRVSVWQVNGAGDSAERAGTLWTMPEGTSAPRVIAADSYDKLVIAHDEPGLFLRQVTMVYDVVAATVAPLTADLNRSGIAVPVKFRGVARHLNFLIGWGYGTAADEDRPEIVRASLPGEPTAFEPEHYWIAGQRGDPVLSCMAAGDVLAVRKPAESYAITGYDRSTFGIRPADQHFGIAASRLAVTVSGVNYFWSLDGPRRSTGGVSEDLALPLDLGGPDPAGLVAPGLAADAFAVYLPGKQEVQFVFGQLAYVLHLAHLPAIQWSFRPYRVALFAGGILYDVEAGGGAGSPGEGGGGTPAALVATVGAITFADEPATPTKPLTQRVSVPVTIAGGALYGGETIELWAQTPLPAGQAEDLGGEIAYPTAWTRLKSQALGSLAVTITGEGLLPGVLYNFAIRLKRSGTPATGYVSGDPTLWPAASRTAGITPMPPAVAVQASVWERTGAATEVMRLTLLSIYNPDPLAAPVAAVPYEYALLDAELSTDAGATWAAIATVTNDTTGGGIFYAAAVDVTGHGETTVQVRLRQRTPWVTGDWGDPWEVWVGPLVPLNVTIAAGVAASGDYIINGDWNAWAADGQDVEIDVAVELGATGRVDETRSAPPSDDASRTVNAPCPTTETEAWGWMRMVTRRFAVEDFSPWVRSAASIPPNC